MSGAAQGRPRRRVPVVAIALLLVAVAATALDAAGASLPGALDPGRVAGLPPAVLLATIAAATLLSEDLACIATGLLVAGGAVSFASGTMACLLGIVAGDLALVLVGRRLGPAAVSRAPLRFLLTEADVERGRAFLGRRGGAVLLAARFVPGLRLPTYVAAGVCRMPFPQFVGWFLLGAALWTPLLVGGATLAGRGALEFFARYRSAAAPFAIALVLLAWAGSAARGGALRRWHDGLRGSWRRWTRWEFWPIWFFYPPVIAYILFQALLRGRWTAFSAANPAIDAGGLIGESKAEILAGLAGAGDRVARWFLVPSGGSAAERTRAVLDGLRAAGLSLPVVLKPDAGQRGLGVAVCRTVEEVARRAARGGEALIVQAYVPGVEFGVFYARRPGAARGSILSITEKVMPELVGDGVRTLERLVLDDDRAVALAAVYEAANGPRWQEVPGDGERVQLVELGTHCRGAIFLDGARHLTPELEEAVDSVARHFEGFYFGRFDLRSESAAAFRRGAFTVIELNGVTSEVTHIYDPKHSLVEAYGALFRQWRLAFEIGEANVARGCPMVGPFGLLRRVLAFRSDVRRRGRQALRSAARTAPTSSSGASGGGASPPANAARPSATVSL